MLAGTFEITWLNKMLQRYSCPVTLLCKNFEIAGFEQIEDEKIKYVYHPDTGWLIDNNNPNKTSHNSDFYYSDKSEVIFADLEIL